MLQGLLLSTFPHFDSPKVSNNELVMKFTFRRGKIRNRVVMVKNSKQRLKNISEQLHYTYTLHTKKEDAILIEVFIHILLPEKGFSGKITKCLLDRH